MTDFAARRATMVDTQVRPADVTKFPIIAAMLEIPRERFVPDAWREAAYAGENIALGDRRVVLDPRTLAKMLDALDIQPDETVLDVGCGLGYSTAVIARLAQAVIAVEEDPALAAEAEAALAAAGIDNAAVLTAPLAAGAPKHAPYDVIAVQGAAERMPPALTDQLREGGRIGCLFMEGPLGVCRIGLRRDGRIAWRHAFHAAAPVLPGFEAVRGFAL
jgi:protein-L-isoaspartate(D-aspartate) O-methyltransferase